MFNFISSKSRKDISDLKEMFTAMTEAQEVSFHLVRREIADLREEVKTILTEATTVNKDLQASVSSLTVALQQATEAVARMVTDDVEDNLGYTQRMEALRVNLVTATTQASDATTALQDQDATFVEALDNLTKKS